MNDSGSTNLVSAHHDGRICSCGAEAESRVTELEATVTRVREFADNAQGWFDSHQQGPVADAVEVLIDYLRAALEGDSNERDMDRMGSRTRSLGRVELRQPRSSADAEPRRSGTGSRKLGEHHP